MYFAAAAYEDRNGGQGHTRLFARAYDHQPDEAEVRHDAFAEANPNWEERYPGYTLHAAAYDWEGTLNQGLAIGIIPASSDPEQHVDRTEAAATDHRDESVRLP